MTTLDHGCAVLVVEDEPLLRLDIAQAFRAAGFAVYEAGTAEDALDALGTGHDIDLVFTDIEMPGRLDGLDLARIVRARWPGLPVLVTSGSVRPEAREISRFIPKPYDTAKIVLHARTLAA